MFIGAYICSSGLVFLVALGLLTALSSADDPVGRWRQQIVKYTLLSLGLSGVGLTLFLVLSAVTGILPVGGAGSYSLPQDYLAYGVVGWLILLIAIGGILSPAFTAVWLHKRHQI